MTDDGATIKRGWRFPAGVDAPDDEDWFRIQYGKTEVHGFSWSGHVDLLHQETDFGGIETDVVDSGFHPEHGIQYAAVKATVIVGGNRFSSLQAADETTNQVRDPEFVFAVAESRALKRAVKKALNIKPVDKDTTQATDEEAGDYDDHGHPREDPVGEVEEDTPDPPEPPTADTDDAAW